METFRRGTGGFVAAGVACWLVVNRGRASRVVHESDARPGRIPSPSELAIMAGQSDERRRTSTDRSVPHARPADLRPAESCRGLQRSAINVPANHFLILRLLGRVVSWVLNTLLTTTTTAQPNEDMRFFFPYLYSPQW